MTADINQSISQPVGQSNGQLVGQSFNLVSQSHQCISSHLYGTICHKHM